MSLSNEVNTQDILSEMFRLKKEVSERKRERERFPLVLFEIFSNLLFVHLKVFVPSYSGSQMVMLKINDMQDFISLPMTKWNIRQPDNDGSRENAFDAG